MRGLYNYKVLLSETQFLLVQKRARKLQTHGTQLYQILYSKGRLIFKTRSATDPVHITYTQTVDVTNCSPENLEKFKYRTIQDIVLRSSLKIHCNCPAFHYWGYKYKAWKLGYGLQKETRRPVIRNPYEQGYVCKHLFLVLQVFPFISSQVASKFKRKMNKVAPKVKDSLEEVLAGQQMERKRLTDAIARVAEFSLPEETADGASATPQKEIQQPEPGDSNYIEPDANNDDWGTGSVSGQSGWED